MNKTTTLAELAKLTDAELKGDGALAVAGVLMPGSRPAKADDLVIAFSTDAAAALIKAEATLALVGEGAVLPDGLKGALICRRPRVAFAKVLQFFETQPHCPPGIHPSAVIDPSAEIGQGVSIGPLSVVGPGARIGAGTRVMSQVTIGAHTVIGADCLIFPGARIGERVTLGARCRIQSNSVIGGEGFSYVTPTISSIEAVKPKDWQVPAEARNNELFRIPSLGTVVLEDEVDIGANTAVDRATMGTTRIGRGTKIDNLVQVAHNVRIGSNVLIAGQSGVAGSSILGDRVVVGGQAGIGDHRKVGDDAIVAAGAGIIHDVPAAEIYGGSPAMRMDKTWDMVFNSHRVGRMIRQLLDLERRLTEMERRAAATNAGGKGQQGAKA